MRYLLPLLAVLSPCLTACGGEDGSLLVVDLRTDFALGAELDRLELLSVRGPEAVSVRARPTGDGLEGVRVAELEDVAPGTYHLAVLASRPDGSLLARTEFIIAVRGTTTARVLLTRDCSGVSCPADDPDLTACVAGMCEDPRCVGGDVEACVSPPGCDTNADCSGVPLACGTRACLEGRCVVEAAGVCGEGRYCEPETGCRANMSWSDGGTTEADAATDGGADGGLLDGGGSLDGGTPDGGVTSVADPRCRNDEQDGDETGVDCGGSCTACADGICSGQVDVPQAECLALVALYTATDGPRWLGPTGWATPVSPCTWTGVSCAGGHVVELDLQSSNLGGTLPAELGNLAELRLLDVRQNAINGEIPPELGTLARLEQLYLSVNHFVGTLPVELGTLSNLQELRASENALTGPLPDSFGAMTSLRDLRLYLNRFHGPIPSGLGDLGGLQRLELQYNSFDGPIPASLGSPPLVTLRLGNNRLSGEVPGSLMGLDATIRDLRLSSNDCLTSSDPELTTWLNRQDFNWDTPNGTVDCP